MSFTAAPAHLPFAIPADCLEAAIAGFADGSAEYASLHRKVASHADEALTMGPETVTAKTSVPPSGDVHDFSSMDPYMWPNPDTPDGLPWIHRDGEVNPTSTTDDYDDGRLDDFCHAAIGAGLGGMLLGEEQYVDWGAKLIRVWFLDRETRMRPNMNFSQARPGTKWNDGSPTGVLECRDFIYVLDGAALMEDTPWMPTPEMDRLKQWFAEFLHWMRTSTVGRVHTLFQNNHGTWDDASQVCFALFHENDPDARQTLTERTLGRIDIQFRADGGQPRELRRTKALGYSLHNIEGWFELAIMAERLGIDLWNHVAPNGGSLKAGMDFLLPYADESVPWPYQQIEPLDRSSFAPYLRLADRAWGRKDGRYLETLQRLFPDAPPFLSFKF